MTITCQDSETIMPPGVELEATMDMRGSTNDPTELTDEDRRLWNIGHIADYFADRLVRSGVFRNLTSVQVGE